LFFILFERGAVGDLRVGHTKLLSGCAWEVRMQSG
jgi:hypothetical protein